MAISDLIVGAESGGNPNATNPNSSATGAGQFITSTWNSLLSQNRPDLVQGKSPEEIAALRSDPELSKQMVDAYAAQNNANLQKNGLPVTPGNTYLSHFAGPDGAVKILQADPNASVADILGAKVVAANPFLKDMTAQGLQAWAAKKMGAEAPQPGMQNNAPASPASPPSAPPMVAPMAPPIFPNQPQPQQQQAAPEQAPAFAQIPEQQAPPIFFAPRPRVNLTNLRNAFHAPVFPRG